MDQIVVTSRNASTAAADDIVSTVRPASTGVAGVWIQKKRIASNAAVSKTRVRAILRHLEALRELGQNRANTAEIAKALRLPEAEVRRAIVSLKDKGVKKLNV